MQEPITTSPAMSAAGRPSRFPRAAKDAGDLAASVVGIGADEKIVVERGGRSGVDPDHLGPVRLGLAHRLLEHRPGDVVDDEGVRRSLDLLHEDAGLPGRVDVLGSDGADMHREIELLGGDLRAGPDLGVPLAGDQRLHDRHPERLGVSHGRDRRERAGNRQGHAPDMPDREPFAASLRSWPDVQGSHVRGSWQLQV